MEIKLTLALPRDQISVPVIRRLMRQAMEVLGVADDVVSDIELALTEACTNVLDHAAEGDEYEVGVGMQDERCIIEVSDRGHGFDGSDSGHDEADSTAEEGRGIQLMRALVDKVEFISRRSEGGTVVRLEKALRWREGSPVQHLTEGRPATKDGPWSRPEASRRAGSLGS